ncbi:MAG: hypothetical protein IKX77_00155 [Clostridia bacterium]|nr:hypothetical protein [Clostridia bacterium]
MKRIIIIVVALLTVISGFSSCLRPVKPADNDSVSTARNTTESTDSVSNEIPEKNPLEGIVFDYRTLEDYASFVTYNREFDLVYGAVDGFSNGMFDDKYMASVDDFIKKYEKNGYWTRKDRLPLMYYLIREIEISREEFVQSNEQLKSLKLADTSFLINVYTDYEIEYLFGDYDNETVMRHLKAPTAFYYEGRLYTIYDLGKLDDSILKAMSENGGLNAYLDFMAEFNSACREYCESKYADSYYLPQYVSGYNQVDEVINGLIARLK